VASPVWGFGRVPIHWDLRGGGGGGPPPRASLIVVAIRKLRERAGTTPVGEWPEAVVMPRTLQEQLKGGLSPQMRVFRCRTRDRTDCERRA
jgi:hypothetical protein